MARRCNVLPVRALLRPRYRLAAMIEGFVVGLILALIDIHSTNEDSWPTGGAYFLAAVLLGLRHGRGAWQVWLPLGVSLYVVHVAAIGHGYRPPYVEESPELAMNCLFHVWPVGVGLAIGAIVRGGIVWLARFGAPKPRQASGPESQQGPQHPVPIDYTHAAIPSLPRQVRQRLTTARLMSIVAVIGVQLALARIVLKNDVFFGFGTRYSTRYSESRFNTLRVGMTREQVRAIAGPPLRVVDYRVWMKTGDGEMWYYSDQPNYLANYWRRWVYFEKGKVKNVIADFWVD